MAPDDTRTRNRYLHWGGRGNRGRDSASDRAPGTRPDQRNAAARFTRRAAILGAGVASMSVVTDYPDWSAHVAQATQIANTGVPLLALPQTVFSNTAIAPAPGAPADFGAFKMNQVSYEIWVAVEFAAGTAVPFCEVQLLWGEPSNAVTMATDSFICAGGETSPGMITRGRGPCKGSNVLVVVTNLDATVTPTVQVRLITHSRPVASDDWRWNNHSNNLQTVPGWTLPHLPDDETVLGIGDDTIPASGGITRLVGPYSGRIKVGIQVHTGVIANLSFFLQPQPPTTYATNNPIGGQANPPTFFEVAGVRAPQRLTFNNLATTSIAVAWSLIAIP